MLRQCFTRQVLLFPSLFTFLKQKWRGLTKLKRLKLGRLLAAAQFSRTLPGDRYFRGERLRRCGALQQQCVQLAPARASGSGSNLVLLGESFQPINSHLDSSTGLYSVLLTNHSETYEFSVVSYNSTLPISSNYFN